MRPNVSGRGMPVWASLIAMMILALGARREAATAMDAQQRSVPSEPERAALMRRHFDQALAIKDAVIRGDVAAVNNAAAALAAQDTPQGLPSVAGPFVTSLKEEARRAAAATTIVSAASESASILATCGNCHQTVGIRPAFPPPSSPAATSAPGGVVGHMLPRIASEGVGTVRPIAAPLGGHISPKNCACRRTLCQRMRQPESGHGSDVAGALVPAAQIWPSAFEYIERSTTTGPEHVMSAPKAPSVRPGTVSRSTRRVKRLVVMVMSVVTGSAPSGSKRTRQPTLTLGRTSGSTSRMYV